MRAAVATVVLGLALLGAAALQARRAEEAIVPTSAEQDAAVEAVREFVTLGNHLRGSGGDPRFAERIPAAPEVVEAILADVAFTRHAGRIEDQQLVRLQVEGVERAEEGGIAVRTREYWVVRSRPVEGEAPEPGPVRADVVRVRYVAAQEGSRWRIASWALESPLARARPEGG